MDKTVKYIILSLGMGIGSYLPVLLGASGIGGWSILGSMVGGFAAVVLIFKLDS